MANLPISQLPQEYTVNIALADLLDHLLRGTGKAVPEDRTTSHNHRFDVKVTYRDIIFVLEAAYDEPGAEIDAKKRLEEGFIDTVSIAVHYPPEQFYRKKTLDEIKVALNSYSIKLRIFTQGEEVSINLTNFMQRQNRKAKNQGGWIEVELNEIVSLMDSIIEFLVTEDTTSELLRLIEQEMQDFSNAAISELGHGALKNRTIGNLRHILFSPEPVAGELELEISDEIVLYHTYVTLFLAALLYESVYRNYDQLRGIMLFEGDVAVNPMRAFREPFAKINDEIDYESVFTVSLEVLGALDEISPGGQIADRIRSIQNRVKVVFSNRALLRQDFIGRVYHRVTGDLPLRKGFATYYTKAEIAIFLTQLVVEFYADFWNSIVKEGVPVDETRIGDFSCGSGTLLSASYSSILSKVREIKDEIDKTDLVEYHHEMIEKVLWGIDALENAVQAASVVLALHEPGTPLENFNTLRKPIRVSGELGSISLWSDSKATVRRRGIRGYSDEVVNIPKFDYIISNPPFSRNTAPGTEEGAKPRIFGFVTNQDAYDSLLKSYQSILNEMVSYILTFEEASEIVDANVGSGKPFKRGDVSPINSGAFFPFITMYEKFLKDESLMSLVLPISVLESSSNFYLRALMLSNFSLDFIIISTDPSNPNFSYSTNLSECLIILRKTASKNEKCTVVRLNELPKNTLEGILMSKKLVRKLNGTSNKLDDKMDISQVKVSSLKEMVWNWSPLIRFPPKLMASLDGLLNNKILDHKVQITKFGEFLNKAATGSIANPRLFRGKFIEDNLVQNNGGPFKLLYEAGRGVMDRILLRPDYRQKSYVLKSSDSNPPQINAGHIIIPESFRLNTMPLIASFTPHNVVSGVAYSVTTGDLETDKALSVWLNSVYGLIMIRTFISTVAGNFGHIRGWHIRSWPVPEISDSEIKKKLGSIFDKFSAVQWGSIPDQLRTGITDKKSPRISFDIEVIQAICPEASAENISRELIHMYSDLFTTISQSSSTINSREQE